MLQSLKKTASGKALAEVALEAVKVCGTTQRQLVLVVGRDLTELFNQSWMVDIQTSKSGKGFGCLLRLTTLDPHARGLWQHEHTEEQDQRPSKLDCDWDAVRSTVVSVFGGVVDDGCEEKTDGDCELVGADNRSSNPFGSRLRLQARLDASQAYTTGVIAYLVEWDKHGNHSHAKARKEASSNKHGDGSSCGLQDDTKAENDGRCHETKATTEKVSCGCTEESAEELEPKRQYMVSTERHDLRTVPAESKDTISDFWFEVMPGPMVSGLV